MLKTRESYTNSWQHSQAFSYYDSRRSIVAVAFAQQLSGALIETYEPGSVLVEIGAGNGALSHYAGEEAIANFQWIETDPNTSFLNESRSQTDLRVAATSAAMPFARGSIDGVVGMSMLDVLSPHDLEQTARGIGEVLRPGGKFTHFMDMAPDFVAEVRRVAADQEFPLPYLHDDMMGLAYISLKNKHILAKIRSLPESPLITETICYLIDNPDLINEMATDATVLPYLGNVLLEHGLVKRVVDDWLDDLTKRLEVVFAGQGMEVIKNGFETTTVTHSRSLLPPKHRPQRYNHVLRSHGVVSLLHDRPDLPKGQVLVEADIHRFVAQRPTK